MFFVYFAFALATKEILADPETTPVPFSISMDQIKKTGPIDCSTLACPSTPNYSQPCGKKCWYDYDSNKDKKATFEYTFKGEKFQIYGTNDPSHGSFKLYIDDAFITDVSQKGTRELYQLQYTSELLTYADHTIRIESSNSDIELYKIAFWPSVNAIRLNSTDIKPLWNVESDGFGGQREWANENSNANKAKTTTISFSKIWIFGGFDRGHGNFTLNIDDDEYIVNEYTSGERQVNTFVYETNYRPYDQYKFSIKQKDEDVLLNCIYYLPLPSPTPVPISVSMDQIKITGPHGCSTDNPCKNPPSLSTPCGKKCWFDIDSNKGKKATFEYTFRGEMFQIYGTYDKGHGSYFVYVDGDKVAEVSQKKDNRELYQLQYTSDLLLYGDHTILVETNNADIEIYKFAYWPAVKGVRLNSTDLRPFWNVQSDDIGGLREWANENSHTKEAKTATLDFSKVWIYGGFDSGHGNFTMTINDKEYIVNEYTSGDRVVNQFVYETEYMQFDTYKFSIRQNEQDVLFNCIYYLPFPEPTPVPFSVSMDEIIKEGPYTCSTDTECSSTIVEHRPCGKKCWFDIDSNKGKKTTFEYTFRGERFQIYGTNDPGHGSYKVLVDGNQVAVVSQKNKRKLYQLQYTSEIFPYGDHKITVETMDADIELYKFAIWPSMHAIRINSTEMKPLWNPESDGIGGLREWANENSATQKPKNAKLNFSKLWIFGGIDPGHGNFSLKIDDKSFIVEEYGPKRDINRFIYETDYFQLEKHDVSFMQNKEDVLFNCFYYLPLPAPTPMATMSPSRTPQTSPLPFFYTDENCGKEKDKRCKTVISNNTNHNIRVLVSDFDRFNQETEDGGAIHIVNAGITCSGNTFKKCSTKNNHCGGAVYITNTYEFINSIVFENVNFFNNEADYGGALYIYVNCTSNSILISGCKFNGNQAHASKNSENKYGGSAIYMAALEAILNDNLLSNNKGPGGTLKVMNSIENSGKNFLRFLSSYEGNVHISNCKFEINKESDCSLFYYGGKNGVKYTLKDCQFSGVLNENSFYINGFSQDKNAPKIHILGCKFDSDFKSSLNQNVQFFSINLNEQIFKSNNSDDVVENKKSGWKLNFILVVAASVLAVVAVIFIAVVVFVLKKNKNDDAHDDSEMPKELKDPFIVKDKLID